MRNGSPYFAVLFGVMSVTRDGAFAQQTRDKKGEPTKSAVRSPAGLADSPTVSGAGHTLEGDWQRAALLDVRNDNPADQQQKRPMHKDTDAGNLFLASTTTSW